MNEVEMEVRAELKKEADQLLISAITGTSGVKSNQYGKGDPAPPARCRPAWRLKKAQRAKIIADIAAEEYKKKAEEAIAAAEALAELAPEPEVKAKPRTRGKAKAK